MVAARRERKTQHVSALSLIDNVDICISAAIGLLRPQKNLLRESSMWRFHPPPPPLLLKLKLTRIINNIAVGKINARKLAGNICYVFRTDVNFEKCVLANFFLQKKMLLLSGNAIRKYNPLLFFRFFCRLEFGQIELFVYKLRVCVF